MRIRLRDHLTYANLASTLALTIALGAGGAYAADLVGTSDLKNGAVTTPKIKGSAVTAGKIKDGQVGQADLNDFLNGQLAQLEEKRSRSETITIPPSAFRATEGATTDVNADVFGAYVVGGSGDILHAPVILPTGSVITEITYFFRDDSPSTEIALELVQVTPTSNIASAVAGTGIVSDNGGFTFISLPNVNATVGEAPLQVVASPAPQTPGAWPAAGNTLTVKGVAITYTTPLS